MATTTNILRQIIPELPQVVFARALIGAVFANICGILLENI
jgi:hypothetical protein